MSLASTSLLRSLLLQAAQPAPQATGLNIPHLVSAIVSTMIFVAIGIVVFAIAFFLITKITPFSIRKEIEDDQNTALGIVIGSVIIGLAIIIAAAMVG